MPVIKKNYTIGIMDETKINEVNDVISKYADITMQCSSHRYFDKHPINADEVFQDVTFFQLKAEDEESFDVKLSELIGNLDELDMDYMIMDDETKDLIVTIDYGGYILVKFDKINIIKPGTYNLIDEMKTMKTDLGYCKGFKPKFRPLSGDLSQVRVNPEIIYIVSDSSQNLKRFKDFISEKLLEFDPNFELEFKHIDPQDF